MPMPSVKPLNQDSITEAVQYWRDGHLVAFGTETVYGLGADAGQARAVSQIFATKQRPQFNPLISHVADPDTAFTLGHITPLARTLADAFWPGPMTLVLRRRDSNAICDLVTAGLDTVALRVPEHKGAQALLAAANIPIAAPSANPSGRLSPTTAEHVATAFADHPEPRLILDMGACNKGLESTVIDARADIPVLLRPGSITVEMITTATGHPPLAPDAQILSPGQLASHYAPDAMIRLNADAPLSGEAWLGFGDDPDLSHAAVSCNLSPEADLNDAAAHLFSMLRQLDQSGAKTIAIAPIPDHDLGVAINDRLTRAAAPRNQ
jgi:L-threonylcarbamoyladenylate synthase